MPAVMGIHRFAPTYGRTRPGGRADVGKVAGPGVAAAARRATAGSTIGRGGVAALTATGGVGAAVGRARWGVLGATPGVATASGDGAAASGDGEGGATRTGATRPITGNKRIRMMGRSGLGPGGGPGGGGGGGMEEKLVIPWLKGMDAIRMPPRLDSIPVVPTSR